MSSIWDKYFNPLTPDTEKVLTDLVMRGGNGDHLEIGTLFGASAILAAMVKKQNGLGGRVVCLDPFDPALLTPTIREKCICDPTPEIGRENARAFGVEDRITIIKAKSNPLPFDGLRFTTAFIDGDHTFEAVWNDWANVSKIVDVAVLFDDDVPHLGAWWLARCWLLQDETWDLHIYRRARMVMAVRK